jgi:Ser/Thr protein kinase RdoA (MazF antagonist)
MLLARAAYLVNDGEREAYDQLTSELAAADSGDGLPEAFTHPDFVMANVVATADSLVIVDWAGAGRGPRAWSLAWLLYAEGVKDLRRVDLVLAGYRRLVTLTDEEVSRLAAMIAARPMVFVAWAVLAGQATPGKALASTAEQRAQAQAIADRARAFLAP